MIKLRIFVLMFMLCLPHVFSFQSTDYYDYSFSRMSYVKGDVFIQRASDLGYEEGTVNLPLVENDKLGTKDGRAEVHLGRKNYLRIDRYTHVDLTGLPRRGNDQVRLNLLSGNMYLRVSFLEREKDFEVHTPDASFYILEEGLFEFRVAESGETEVRVLAGKIEAAGESGSVPLHAEERLVASNGFFLSDPEYILAGTGDGFAEWNRSREELLRRSVKRTYLPPELHAYEEELAYSGNWVNEYPYGYVWVPRVRHRTWRPYHFGRWSWYRTCGWCWIPSESWGWCVSHYGRWHWRFELGWYWIPSRGWGPGWVHWHCGSSYIGWCPSSYYGYPIVIANNRFYGRYDGHHYPMHSRALTIVRRNQLQARRISKVALTQGYVKRLGKVSLASRQPNIRYSVQKSGLSNPKAAKILARSNVRAIRKSYTGSSTLRASGKSPSIRIRNSIQATPDSRSLRSPVSNRPRSRDISGTSRIRGSSSALRSGSPGKAAMSRRGESRSRSAVRTYPSREMTVSRSRSFERSREWSNFSADSPVRTAVKSYRSRIDTGQTSRTKASSGRSSMFQKGRAYESSPRSSSYARYPTRKSYSSSRYRGAESGSRHSRTSDRKSFGSAGSYTERNTRSYRYNSGSRYSSGRRTPSRSSSGYSYGTSRSNSKGRYSSSSRSSSSRFYSRSGRASSSGKSYSRGRGSSSRSSPSRSSRSSSSSSSNRSSSSRSRKK